MRSYSDIEARAIFERKPILVTTLEDSPILTEAPVDVIQFIADLEFEANFAMLLRSIELRVPLL